MIDLKIKDNNGNILYEKNTNFEDLDELDMAVLEEVLLSHQNDDVYISLYFEIGDEFVMSFKYEVFDNAFEVLNDIKSMVALYQAGRVPVSQVGRLGFHDGSVSRRHKGSASCCHDGSVSRRHKGSASRHHKGSVSCCHDERVGITLDVLPGTMAGDSASCHPVFSSSHPHADFWKRLVDKGDHSYYRDKFITSQELPSIVDELLGTRSCVGGDCSSEDVATEDSSEQVLQDFIGYLRTLPTWADLLDELRYYDEPDSLTGKKELIRKFQEYERNKGEK